VLPLAVAGVFPHMNSPYNFFQITLDMDLRSSVKREALFELIPTTDKDILRDRVGVLFSLSFEPIFT